MLKKGRRPSAKTGSQDGKADETADENCQYLRFLRLSLAPRIAVVDAMTFSIDWKSFKNRARPSVISTRVPPCSAAEAYGAGAATEFRNGPDPSGTASETL